MSSQAVTNERIWRCDLCAYQRVSEKLPQGWVTFDITSDLRGYVLYRDNPLLRRDGLPATKLGAEVCYACALPFVTLLPELMPKP